MYIDYRNSNITPIAPLFLAFFLNEVKPLPVNGVDHTEGVLVRTVPAGSTVVLRCRSNDATHNFHFWHFVDKDIIIGPSNKYDLAKFNYGILTGNLTIKGVSSRDEGLYECVSRAVKGDDINIRIVKMIVQNDLQEVYENDYHINLIRILIALITIVLLSMGAWFVYRIWKDRYKYPRYLEQEEDDDESTEELFSQPSTSKPPSVNSHIVPGKSKKSKEPSFDDVDISTDFKSIMDTANDK